ncbi:hypothetical protein [Paenibacillus solani]|uniref:hypothetical protein n=1 Tax=Paenibacillus solani TaxID=1705565 RepID=UPI003D2CFB8B
MSALLITKGLDFGLGIRGATSVGKFISKDNIFVGPAIDEVAAWYEISNWIGVIQTPSAKNIFLRDTFSNLLVEYNAPIKGLGTYKTYCPNWPTAWKNSQKKTDTQLHEIFKKMNPMYPEVAIKLQNTIDFYDFSKDLKVSFK